ncbi:MAG: S1C family serine protease [Firmicutes bacterium]|nr:S1C family serine protease [Bacillota bacterium]
MKKFLKAAALVCVMLISVTFMVGCGAQGERGESAFEIAVRNGFMGTEQEWLASLQGNGGQDGQGTDEFMQMIRELYEASDWPGDFLSFLAYHFQGPTGPQGGGQDLTEHAQRAIRSSVGIIASFSVAGGNSAQSGSGVIYQLNHAAGDAYIITNYHVIGQFVGNNYVRSTNIGVFLFGMQHTEMRIPATLLGGSALHDIAILRVRNSATLRNAPVLAATLAPNVVPVLGSSVMAVGNPLNFGISVTDGVVSTQSELIEMPGIDDPRVRRSYRVFRTTAAINPGNSGGGVFTSTGDLLGIVQARMFSDGDLPIDNIGYVIPLDITLRITHQILDRVNNRGEFNGTPLSMRRPILGIQQESTNPRFGIDTDGNLYIRETIRIRAFESPNFNINQVLMIGDTFTSVTYVVRGQSVTREVYRLHHLPDALIDVYQPTTVTFGIIRNGNPMSVNVTVHP